MIMGNLPFKLIPPKKGYKFCSHLQAIFLKGQFSRQSFISVFILFLLFLYLFASDFSFSDSV